MLNRILLIFSLCVLSISSNAKLAMGGWRTHFSYNSVTQITQSKNLIFALSDGALFSIDKADDVVQLYNKTNGLNGTYISQIEFDSLNNVLLIAYADGNIDLIEKTAVSNIPDFLNKQMIVKKDVNHISFYQNKAYLSCNFGILVINLLKKEVADTYIIGPNASDVKVLNSCVNQGKIYALTSTALFTAALSNPNLANFEFWSTVTNLPVQGVELQSVKSFNGNLYLQAANKLYKYDGSNWTTLLPGETINYFGISENKLLVSAGSRTVYSFDKNLTVKQIALDTLTADALYDEKNSKYWFAANTQGVFYRKQLANETAQFNYFKPDGPAMNSPFAMKFSGEKLFVVPGGRWIFELIPGQVMMFEEDDKSTNKWINISNKSIVDKTGIVCTDFISVAVDALDKTHFFAASYSSGLYEFKNNEFAFYHNFTNSPIEVANAPNIKPGSYQYQMLGASVFDKDGNLWILNQYANNAVKILLKNGSWEQLPYPGIDPPLPSMGEILISNQNQNQKWIYSARPTRGIFVFDDNGTISNTQDDKTDFIQSFQDAETGGTISPSYYYSIAQDKHGVVWIGTEQGPFLCQNPASVFQLKSNAFTRIKIPRGDDTNLADYLLGNEKIKAIAIDGANRKWLGTETSGVYLMSENGQETIQHFNTANSPLPSDNILSLAIQPKTGEVFIGTSLGLVSYQSDAIDAENEFGDVHAYPNPVRENFKGVITITGLVDDTQVKITDLSGNLICQTVSNGSLATWDGKDLQGRKVNTGIYMAICVSADGTKSTITKIMVIN